MNAILALGVAVLAGCEAVAGIKDINLSAEAGDDGGAPSADDGGAGADATTPGDATPQADGGGGAPDGTINDGSSAGNDGNGSVGPADGPGGATGDDHVEGASPVDAGGGPDAGDVGPRSDASDGGLAIDAPADVAPDGASTPDTGAGADADAGLDAAPPPVDATAPPVDASLDAGDDSAFVTPDGAPGVTEIIDNMESQTGVTALLNGRDGFWFVYDDGTDGGTLTPAVGGSPPSIIAAIVPPRGASNFAAHVQGMGFAGFAGMGVDMVDMGGTKQLYDATAYQGFRFWGRSATGPLAVRFSVPDVNTNTAGHVCTTCGDNFGVNITLTTGWTSFIVYYTQLAQLGFGHPNGSDVGGPTALAASQIYGCQFQVSNQSANNAFDIWIDDIEFIKN